jgi:hypothetical protein
MVIHSRQGGGLQDRSVRWSWVLLLASWPWHLIGGLLAIVVTRAAGGDFTSGTDVPEVVYRLLYAWMIAPLVASMVVGVVGWARRHAHAALIPVALSGTLIVVITVFGFEELLG